MTSQAIAIVNPQTPDVQTKALRRKRKTKAIAKNGNMRYTIAMNVKQIFQKTQPKRFLEAPVFFIWQGVSSFLQKRPASFTLPLFKKSGQRSSNGINQRFLTHRLSILLILAPFLLIAPVGCMWQTKSEAVGNGRADERPTANQPVNADGPSIAPGTGKSAETEDGAVLAKRLPRGRFALVGVDGALPAATMRTPELTLQDDWQVSGGICNRFRGKGEFDGVVLRVDRLAVTRMLCPDDNLNEIESIFVNMLQNGARLDFDGRKLVMEQGGHRLEWVREHFDDTI